MIKNPRTNGKIKTHYGMQNYFQYFKKEYPDIKINNLKYYNIIQDFNKEIINLIIEDNMEYILPHLGSSLSVKKAKSLPRIQDGKLINNTPVDWVATNQLWNDDIETKEKKLLVRYSNYHSFKYVFRVYFKKYILQFKNKKYFKFKTNRTFSRALGSRIKDEEKNQYDAFLLY